MKNTLYCHFDRSKAEWRNLPKSQTFLTAAISNNKNNIQNQPPLPQQLQTLWNQKEATNLI